MPRSQGIFCLSRAKPSIICCYLLAAAFGVCKLCAGGWQSLPVDFMERNASAEGTRGIPAVLRSAPFITFFLLHSSFFFLTSPFENCMKITPKALPEISGAASLTVLHGDTLLQAFANPEDALRNGGLQYYREDPDVERCRRRVQSQHPAPKGQQQAGRLIN